MDKTLEELADGIAKAWGGWSVKNETPHTDAFKPTKPWAPIADEWRDYCALLEIRARHDEQVRLAVMQMLSNDNKRLRIVCMVLVACCGVLGFMLWRYA